MKKILIIVCSVLITASFIQAQNIKIRSVDDQNEPKMIIGIKDSLNPDVYIDGVKYDYKILDIIDQKKISTMTVLKEEAVLKEYNAPNGAILITTKAASGKSEAPGEIRIRATGNFNSLDPAIVLDGLSDEEVEKIKSDVKIRAVGNANNKTPIIVIDGKVTTQEELSKLSPSDIQSISVLKEESLKELYKAPNGVIVVKTKKKKE